MRSYNHSWYVYALMLTVMIVNMIVIVLIVIATIVIAMVVIVITVTAMTVIVMIMIVMTVIAMVVIVMIMIAMIMIVMIVIVMILATGYRLDRRDSQGHIKAVQQPLLCHILSLNLTLHDAKYDCKPVVLYPSLTTIVWSNPEVLQPCSFVWKVHNSDQFAA